jgi:CBS domain containing-hemolysin-like protein
MTPRLDVAGVPADASVEEGITRCLQTGHARLPAYEGSLDNVIGVFDIRELGDSIDDDFTDLAVSEVVSQTLHVPESKNIDDLLSEMREHRIHMAIVIDEFGATEGLVTMEDLTEEIVGEILVGDEEHPIEFVDETEALVRGEVTIDEVNATLDIDLPEGEEFEAIAGFIFNLAGRLVEEGEEFGYGNVTLRVEQVEDTRIRKARVVVDHEASETVVDEESARGTESR